ncbi:hypothetical protein ILUMI_19504 [Ignelater luminosus]|uniref:Uncharacterized protein n=1 Tax=Ignelater luminosus TaxID=2038154 RepID=A0A8K0CI39_IGNLU|nr:hypothetical protein ILUMI_19504 [Ignelater luminosus]
MTDESQRLLSELDDNIPLSESAKPKTAFITPDETGQFNRMMFGLVNAPFEFSRLMALVLGHLRNKVFVFQALQDANLISRVTKCRFGVKSVELLEFTISGQGMSPSIIKLELFLIFRHLRM